MSLQLPNISKTGSTKQLTSRSSNSLKKSSHGFSSSSLGHGFSNLTPRNSLKAVSGLEEEMARWRRLHHTRAVNARIKAVRSGGKRHSSCITLRETMDHAAMLRREEAIHPEPFTAEKAWGLLNCGYLRLTQSNISTLEDMCSAAGYDISSHPHRSTEDAANDMQAVFEQLRENRRLQPDVTSQLKFRQSLLFKRLSEGLFTHI
uniref:uncharacterized protein LOC120331767 n=1 Tax=Styela clava TaxID=7725 RepID=UPI001939E1BD|nr:uncharacterized protein LOC120331767 [Styela clava]XP_039254848.1 uncharacterized protein LOC120331767 [Styela clava]